MKQVLAFAMLGALAACQHNGPSLEPAVLSNASDANMTALKAHLADALGTQSIGLGASDPSEVSLVSVLPPPLGEHETRSPARPAVFRLFTQDGDCFMQRGRSDTLIELTGVTCRPEG